MDNLIAVGILWVWAGSSLAIADFVGSVIQKLFNWHSVEWKDIFTGALLSFFLWPVCLIAFIMQILMPSKFLALGNYLKKKTRYWAKPVWQSDDFDPLAIKKVLLQLSSEEWKKPAYQYDNHLEFFVYLHKKTGKLRLARNQSTAAGKYVLCERWVTWIGKHDLFNCERTSIYKERE